MYNYIDSNDFRKFYLILDVSVYILRGLRIIITETF